MERKARPYAVLGREQLAEAEVYVPTPKRGRPRKTEKTGQKFPESERDAKGSTLNLSTVLTSRIETCVCGKRKLVIEIYL